MNFDNDENHLVINAYSWLTGLFDFIAVWNKRKKKEAWDVWNVFIVKLTLKCMIFFLIEQDI